MPSSAGISSKLTRLVLAAVLLAGTAGSSFVLAIFLQRRVPLRAVLGPVCWILLVCLAAAVFWGARRLLGELGELRRGAPRERPLAPFRAMFVAGVLTWLAILAFVQPAERLWVLAALGIGFGAWSLTLEMRPRALDFGLTSLCATVVLLELGMRGLAALHPTPLLARFGDLPEAMLESYRMPAGRMHMGFPCNSSGHYDDEFRRRGSDERLVATIGDSFSLGVVPHELHYTTVCERELGIPVANLGIAGTGPPEYLTMLLAEALPLDPDIVVVGVFVGNDLSTSVDVRFGRRVWLGQWLERESVLLCLVPRRISKLAEERRLAPGATPVAEVQGARESRSGSVEELFPWVLDPTLETPTFSERNFHRGETDRARSICILGPADLEPFFDAMLLMKKSAGSIPLCVLLIPDEFQVEDAVWEGVCAQPGGSGPLARDHAQEILVPWFERNGIPCLDLLPVLRAVPPMEDGRRHLYHLCDTHFNARGNRATGTALAQFLRPRLPSAIPR